jgi:hypothetical protein
MSELKDELLSFCIHATLFLSQRHLLRASCQGSPFEFLLEGTGDCFIPL